MDKAKETPNPNHNHYEVNADYPTGIEVATTPEGGRIKSRFYFFLASPPVTGGDLVTIEHARALIKAGVDARFLYLPNKILGKKISDFPPDVPINMLDDRVTLYPTDFLISGESQGPLYRDLEGWLHGGEVPNIVMHNQAVHWIPFAFSCPEKINGFKMAGLINNSLFAQQYMKEGLKIDTDKVFNVQELIVPVTEIPEEVLAMQSSLERSSLPLAQKPKCKISFPFNVRKRKQELSFLTFAFLSIYPEYKDKVEFNPFYAVDHAELLKQLRSSDIFIAGGYFDSHNLMAIEGMAAGCHLLGYTGLTTEVKFFNSNNGWWFDEKASFKTNIRILKEAVDLYYSEDSEQQARRQALIKNGEETAKLFAPDSENAKIVEAYRHLWEVNVASKRNDTVFAWKEKGYFLEGS